MGNEKGMVMLQSKTPEQFQEEIRNHRLQDIQRKLSAMANVQRQCRLQECIKGLMEKGIIFEKNK